MTITKAVSLFTAGLFMLSSAFSAPAALTAAAEEIKTKDEYVASLIYKNVEIDYNVVIEPDEFGVFTPDDLMKYVTFGIFSAEYITFENESDTIPPNSPMEEGEVAPIFSNQTSTTKKVYFGDYDNEDKRAYCSLPKGRYYIKQTGISDIVTVSEQRTYFTVGEDTHNEKEYIDLTGTTLTVTPLVGQPTVKAVTESDDPAALSGVDLLISHTDNSTKLQSVIYKGVSDEYGSYDDIPKLPLGEYKFSFTSDMYSFRTDSNSYVASEDIVFVDVDNVNGVSPLYITAIGSKIDNDSDTDTTSNDDKIKELEAEIAQLQEKNSDLESEIAKYKAKETSDNPDQSTDSDAKSEREAELDAKIAELENELESYKAKEQSDSDAKSERETELEAKIAELEKELESYKAKEQSDSEAKSERESKLEAKIAELEKELESYKAKEQSDSDTKSERETELEAKIAELEKEIYIYAEKITGDIDGDGDITANDALEILRHSVGLKSILDE